MGNSRYWLHTLGCPKNQVDSEKLAGTLAGDGYRPADRPEDADLVVVNTCAFIEAARQESIDTILELADARRKGARLVVTGCMAERYGDELAAALPEVDLVARFGERLTAQPVALGARRLRPRPARVAEVAEVAADDPIDLGGFDLLELPRPSTSAPWAYVKVAEGCDRSCGFCAIPSFRGKQRSRSMAHVLAEVEALAGTGTGTGTDAGTGGGGGGDEITAAAAAGVPVREIVLVAQDLASYGRDRSRRGDGAVERAAVTPIVRLLGEVAARVDRVRLLYLYPSALTDELIDAVLSTGVSYFDLSLQHVSRPHLVRMRRWGDGERFLDRIARIRRADPTATFRSSFILGYPGETEDDHDTLLAFLREATLDWAGFFPFSPEEGTHAVGLPDQVPGELALERLRECAELQDTITARRRDALVGRHRTVLVDAPGLGRTVHEAPEIDGVVRVPTTVPVGALVDVAIVESTGIDLVGEPLGRAVRAAGRQPKGEIGTGIGFGAEGSRRPGVLAGGPEAVR